MADQDFPGFVDDEPPQKAEKKPANANPFAGQQVVLPGSFAPPVAPSSEAVPVAKPGPATAAPAKPANAPPVRPAPSAIDKPDDPDLKPGSRKDLWHCPHCGAGNVPERTTCRSCAKSPQEAVVIPWHRTLVGRLALVAGVAALIALVWLVTRTDLSCVEPGPGTLDKRPRQAGSGEGFTFAAGPFFRAKRGFALSGRVLASASQGGVGNALTVTMALKGLGSDDQAFNAAAAEPATPGTIALHLVFPGADRPKLERGTWLSLSGSEGVLTDGMNGNVLPEGPIQVLVKEWKTKDAR